MPHSSTTLAADESTPLQHRHLLDLSTYSREEIVHILDTAEEFRAVLERPIRQVPTLQGTTVASLFFEPSTRTKLSFGLAAGRLSAETVSLSKSGSSVKKGETLKDTARNVEAMKVDVVVLRHSSPGAPHFLSRRTDSVILNAGDGAHAHPTQALLDVLTMREHIDTFEGLNVSIIGDITHSRVARSNINALTTLGANVTLCGPATMLPAEMEQAMDVRTTTDLDAALDNCDIAMALRIQMERQDEGLFPSIREYHMQFGITPEHLEQHPDLLIMHPGPVNRGVELSNEVVDHDRAIILSQVTNGVALRMAVLYLLAPQREGA
ncbi:aspartate carbamoyltransferase [Salinibacter sp. 10B]|uniref:aspartate carbamoyltransferase catalytic subunit n=1 Tax=Salinibacter sp. 10B TaxID=1923971 RepID=UPI000CF404BD|nr:aspartate carbamoyltransferase catalytic subunit [Salinibacter sp. 10B]PQJ36418.1 aspartate carbamoyltransferase [Salinibacter sp. 10B]